MSSTSDEATFSTLEGSGSCVTSHQHLPGALTPHEDELEDPSKPMRRHIAEIDFAAFYAEVFPSLDAAKAFYSELDLLPPAKTVFHQVARMVWLADQIDEVARGRPAFQVLFYFIAAELVAKLRFQFKGEGESRKYVHRFFAEICDEGTRNRLSRSFCRLPYGDLTSDEVVNLLYRIRSDVVHEGMYYCFELKLEEDNCAQVVHVDGVSFSTTLTIQELRRMILKGAVSASKVLLEDAKQSAKRAISHSKESK